VTAGETHHLLGDEIERHLLAHRNGSLDPSFPPVALDVVFGGETHASVSLHGQAASCVANHAACNSIRAPASDFPYADGLGGQEDPLGVESVQNVAESLSLFAHHPPSLHRQVVVEDLTAGHSVPGHFGDGANVDMVWFEVGEKQAQPVETGVGVSGAHEQQHDFGLQGL